MGVYLVSYATRRRAGMEAREAEDVVNDYGRDPIGEGQEERVSYIFTFPITELNAPYARPTEVQPGAQRHFGQCAGRRRTTSRDRRT
jgi:hypothetical protein